MTDALENSFAQHEAFNESNNDSQYVAQSVREILQHAHRHVSDAIDADKNNYGESAVRSYRLAMDYFKTYLKMNDIGSSGGGKFGAFRVAQAIQLARWKEEVYEEKERGFSILVVVYVVFVCFSLCFFFFVCLFHSLAMTYKNGRLRDVYEDADGRTFLGFRDKVVVRFFLSSVFFQCFRLSFSFSFSHF